MPPFANRGITRLFIFYIIRPIGAANTIGPVCIVPASQAECRSIIVAGFRPFGAVMPKSRALERGCAATAWVLPLIFSLLGRATPANLCLKSLKWLVRGGDNGSANRKALGLELVVPAPHHSIRRGAVAAVL